MATVFQGPLQEVCCRMIIDAMVLFLGLTLQVSSLASLAAEAGVLENVNHASDVIDCRPCFGRTINRVMAA